MFTTDTIQLIVACLTFGALVFAGLQLHTAIKHLKIQRAHEMIDRYYTHYFKISNEPEGFAYVGLPGSLYERISSDIEMTEKQRRKELDKAYLVRFFDELGDYWLRNSIDKTLIVKHIPITETFDRYRDKIRELREEPANALFCMSWQLMVEEIRKPKPKSFNEYLIRQRMRDNFIG